MCRIPDTGRTQTQILYPISRPQGLLGLKKFAEFIIAFELPCAGYHTQIGCKRVHIAFSKTTQEYAAFA